ncbi:Protein of unknown function [Lutimaribacter pacificus]|uniref:UDP-N-acetylmuramate--alanine ligase n=1 Tax=Lutimaribacter pacificus TaxID=391948 RepID=A0A1H0JJQ8_9RHOB|nr:DUF2484 family protein [Lutimaribacter pacificus]SDO44035.1 Protein of unknown function [Lutimaribacter pacificus]SHK09261.1 Protein of unknown function [Lutimaribacter pacificus]
MSIPVLLAILWVIAATVTAMLPIRRQYAPGVILLLAAPVLIVWMGALHGWWLAVLGLAAFASMMRRPLRYLWRRARGERPELPE